MKRKRLLHSILSAVTVLLICSLALPELARFAVETRKQAKYVWCAPEGQGEQESAPEKTGQSESSEEQVDWIPGWHYSVVPGVTGDLSASQNSNLLPNPVSEVPVPPPDRC